MWRLWEEMKKDGVSLESTSVDDVSKDAFASDMQTSDTEDSVKGTTSFGTSKRTNTRSEACRGPGRKASRFFRSMVYQGKMIAAEVDKLNPEEGKRLYKEMRLYKAKSSQLTTEIIRQHHAEQAEQFRGDGTNLLKEMLREGVWPDKDVEAVEPTTEEKRSIHSRILKDGMCLACGKQCDDSHAMSSAHQRVLKEECQLDRVFGPPAGFGLRRWGSGCKVCTRKGLMEYFGDAVF